MKKEIIEGFECYAPELCRENDGFSAESFASLFQVEQSSFWFRSRNELICHLFERYVAGREAEVCEIGCGTGYVLKGLSSMANLNLSGSEIHVQGLKYARQRLPYVNFFQADATAFPFEEKYDAIGAFDVLEHISDDRAAMNCVRRALRPGGYFFITVPQYSWMWSTTDDVAFHKRRYSRTELREKLVRAGFSVEFISSFVFLLFPVMALQRIINRGNSNAAVKAADRGPRIPSVVNEVFYWLTRIDVALIKSGVRLPFGGSIVCVARKNA